MRVRPEVREVFEAALTTLRDLGHGVHERHPAYGAVGNANSVRYLAGVAHDVDHLADPTATERRTRHLARIGRALPARTVAWGRRQGQAFGDRMEEFFASVDVLVTPTAPRPPVPAGAILGRGLPATLRTMLPMAAFTGPWNGSGLPALNVPFGATPGGVPVGVQLVGPRGSESTLLRLAARLEAVAGWVERRPPIG